MGGYGASAALATARVVGAGALVLVVVPWALFGRRRRMGSRAPEHLVAGIVLWGAAVPVLAAARLLDLFSLTGVVVAIACVQRRGRLRASLQAAWTRGVEGVLRRAEAEPRRRSIPLPRTRGRAALEAVAAAALVVLTAVTHLRDAFAHPADDAFGAAQHIADLNGLAVRHLWPIGVRPVGVPAVLAVIGRVASVDSVLLVRLATPLVAVLTVLALLWAGRRLGGRPSAGLLAAGAGVLAVGPTWPLTRSQPSDALAVGAAAALVVVVVALLGERLVVPSARSAPVWAAMAAVALIAPFVGVALLVAALLGWVVHRLSDAGPLAGPRLPIGLVVATALAVGTIPLGVLLGHPLYRGTGDLASRLGDTLRSGTLPPDPPGIGPVVVVVAVLLSALVLVLPRRALLRTPGARVAAVVALVFVVLALPVRFGLPALLLPAVAATVAAPLLALAAALAVDALLGWLGASVRLAAVAVAVAVALVLGAPLAPAAAERRQPDGVVRELYRIKDTRRPYDWTVVDRSASLLDVDGHGFFLPIERFVAGYDPTAWRFDPDRRDLALPTRSTFLFLRRADLRAEPVAVSDAGPAALARDLGRTEALALRRWIRAYEAAHGPLRVVHDDHDLLVVEIRRTEAEDRAFQRGGTACQPVPADDLLLPTPDEFERCGR
jgi:hypothetical protein